MVTGGMIFSSKCTKKRSAAGLCPDPLGSLSAPPDPLAAMRGPTSKGGEARAGEAREGSDMAGSVPLFSLLEVATLFKPDL